jgi:hypothetical protein
MIDKPRNIRVLRSLPISEMTDEEIVKAALDRLQSKSIMLCYDDGERQVFMGRYRKDGKRFIEELKFAWEAKFGKLKSIKDLEIE